MKRFVFVFFVIFLLHSLSSCENIKELFRKDEPPFFHDVTIELGERVVLSAELFRTENARRDDKISVLTDMSSVDTSVTGHSALQFAYGDYIETVTFTVQDTTPPDVEFRDFYTNPGYTPDVNDFIVSVSDLSRYDTIMKLPDTFSYEMPVDISVVDCEGNVTSGTVMLYTDWMNESFTIEFGDKIEENMFLISPEHDEGKIPQDKLDEINSQPVGEYVVEAESNGRANRTTVRIVDTTPPELELEAVSVAPGAEVSAEDFVYSLFDLNMEDISVALETEIDYDLINEPQTVKVSATDRFGNRTEEETTFVITLYIDKLPPVFKGLGELTVVRGVKPDYSKGVTATDDSDGAVHFKVNSSNVDYNKMGTYYAVYSAVDSFGNVATKQRKITVVHNDEDTAALVKQISDGLGTFETKREEALACRAYVMSIKYIAGNNGNGDAVWFGFTKNKGECYVHAVCLKALLDERGFETYLCRTREKYPIPHFWVIVKIDDTWWHIDGTPVGYHPKYELMNDTMRLETVVNYGTKTYRDWDFDAYPKCLGNV